MLNRKRLPGVECALPVFCCPCFPDLDFEQRDFSGSPDFAQFAVARPCVGSSAEFARGCRPSPADGSRKRSSCQSDAPLAFILADNYVSEAWNEGMHLIDGMDRQAWFVVLCGVVIVGGFCLRGFGSRSNY